MVKGLDHLGSSHSPSIHNPVLCPEAQVWPADPPPREGGGWWPVTAPGSHSLAPVTGQTTRP